MFGFIAIEVKTKMALIRQSKFINWVCRQSAFHTEKLWHTRPIEVASRKARG